MKVMNTTNENKAVISSRPVFGDMYLFKVIQIGFSIQICQNVMLMIIVPNLMECQYILHGYFLGLRLYSRTLSAAKVKTFPQENIHEDINSSNTSASK